MRYLNVLLILVGVALGGYIGNAAGMMSIAHDAQMRPPPEIKEFGYALGQLAMLIFAGVAGLISAAAVEPMVRFIKERGRSSPADLIGLILLLAVVNGIVFMLTTALGSSMLIKVCVVAVSVIPPLLALLLPPSGTSATHSTTA